VKLKLDENIPQSAATRLAALGYDVDTVLEEQLGGRSDEDVWAAAQGEGRFLVTHDLDFSDTRKFEPGKHAGVLIVRLPDSDSGASATISLPGSLSPRREAGSAAWSSQRCAKCAWFVARRPRANDHKRKNAESAFADSAFSS